jgi:DNA-directed RNA polymerase specialized sigma24 family protein
VESLLRLGRADTIGVENLGGWLTTVVARVCLNMLRSRQTRRGDTLGVHAPEPAVSGEDGVDSEHQAVLASRLGHRVAVDGDALGNRQVIAAAGCDR